MTGRREKSICYVATTGKCLALFLLPQVKYLAAHGWRVAVAADENARLRRELPSGVEYHVLPMTRGIDFFGAFRHISALRKIFIDGKFTFVHYFMPNAAFYASIAAWTVRVPFRYYQLGGLRYSASTGLKRLLLKTIERISCGCSTRIVTVSRGNLETAAADGIFRRSKAVVIGHGGSKAVDLTLFDPANKAEWRRKRRGELGINADDMVIGFAGSLRRDKGTGELIEAFAILKRTVPGLKLLLIGDRDFYATVAARQRLAAASDPDVIFVPPLDGPSAGIDFEDVPSYESCLDILAFPSYREGLPNVVLECEALEIPVVAADVPGTPDAMPSAATALLVPARSPEKLAEKLLELILSPEMRRDYSKKGRDFVEKYFNQAILMEEILREKEANL
ncbi:MAG: glycosyltransferase [Victivallaceae bacterium]|nr:glycosyltransferase [Victivallaceae bacterium]